MSMNIFEKGQIYDCQGVAKRSFQIIERLGNLPEAYRQEIATDIADKLSRLILLDIKQIKDIFGVSEQIDQAYAPDPKIKSLMETLKTTKVKRLNFEGFKNPTDISNNRGWDF